MATTTHHIEHVDHIPAEDLITDPKRQRWILIAMIVSLVAVISWISMRADSSLRILLTSAAWGRR